MLAYRRSDFEARARVEAIEGWEDDGLIDGMAAADLKSRFPDPFYEPNTFVRIGLFVFGLICAGAAQGLFFLVASPRGSEGTIAALLIFSGCLALGAQEMLARRPKPFFRAGLEEAMAYLGLSCVLTGFLIQIDFGKGGEASIALIIAAGAGLAAMRYADSLLAAIAMGALLFALFDFGKGMGDAAVSALPFAVIAFSSAIAFACGWARRRKELGPWEHVFDCLRLLGLILAYAGGNYLLVREVGQMLLGQGAAKEEMLFGFLFQVWTYTVPPAYIAYGLWRKDRQFLDAGFVLVAAAVGTYKYYHHVMSLEMGLVLGGAALLVVAWAALKAFRPHRFGISAAVPTRDAGNILLNAEALAQLHASSGPEFPEKFPEGMEGGGGKFGGGGAQGGF